MLVIDFFRLLSFIVGVVVFFQGLNTGNLLTGIVLALLMGGLIYVLPFVRAYAEARLKRKLKDLLDQITDSYRNKGIEVRFPVSKKMFLVFFACPYCCDNYNFSSIEVWSYLANS